MKRQILVSSLILLFGAVITEGSNLAGFPSYDQSQDGFFAYREGELLVRFMEVEPGSQPAEGPEIMGPLSRRAIRDAMSEYVVAGAKVEREYDHIVSGLAVVKLPGDLSFFDAIVRFNSSGNVVYAEPNYRIKLCAVPNDPNFPDQWALNNTGQLGGVIDADIDANDAWDIATGDPNIIVAVLDTGIDYDHPDLAANMWINPGEDHAPFGVVGPEDFDGINDDGNVDSYGLPLIDDIYGYDFAGASGFNPFDGDSDPIDYDLHGTHVAGHCRSLLGRQADVVEGHCRR